MVDLFGSGEEGLSRRNCHYLIRIVKAGTAADLGSLLHCWDVALDCSAVPARSGNAAGEDSAAASSHYCLTVADSSDWALASYYTIHRSSIVDCSFGWDPFC